MKVYEGFTEVERTEDRLVIMKKFGSRGNGTLTLIGNPNPDPVKREEYINEIIQPLIRSWDSLSPEEQARRLKKEYS